MFLLLLSPFDFLTYPQYVAGQWNISDAWYTSSLPERNIPCPPCQTLTPADLLRSLYIISIAWVQDIQTVLKLRIWSVCVYFVCFNTV